MWLQLFNSNHVKLQEHFCVSKKKKKRNSTIIMGDLTFAVGLLTLMAILTKSTARRPAVGEKVHHYSFYNYN